MTFLHAPTLALAIAIVQSALTAILLFFLFTRKTYPGFARLISCQVFWCAAYFLILGRGVLPDAISIVLANYLIILGLGILYEGLAEIADSPSSGRTRAMIHLGGLACIALMSWHLYIEPNFNARVAELNVYRIAMSGLCVALVLRHRASPQFRAVLPLMMVLFGVSIVSSAGRAFLVMQAAPIESVSNDLMFHLHMLVDLFLFVVFGFIVLLLSTVRTEQELEVARRQAEHASRADPLTGLWNRLHFESAGRFEEARAKRYKLPLSVMVFDIDHFKDVNDRNGHLTGDSVIRAVASVATDTLRSSDLIFRWGGEEFVVLLPVDIHAAADAAEKLRLAIEGTEIPGCGKVTVSVGVAQMDSDKDLMECLQRADKQLYRAKEAGRNRTMVQAGTGGSGTAAVAQEGAL
ncbi:MAG TPA: GGDEF domain-containing protein [Noviherbaspirillum sp.]|nr:GGDEF domain-containing protein [Noviherbaspirillum sp.]